MKKTYPNSRLPHDSNSSAKRAFALVLALVLMSFTLLLLLSLTSLVQVQIQSAGTQNNLEQARQNALLAMNIALGELQASLGPDQRVNINAAQALPEGTTSQRREWVGVYESWKETDATRPTPVFKRWLVSGPNNEVIKSDPMAVTLGASTRDLVNADIAEYKVEAGEVEIDSTNSYSWWVSDENSKLHPLIDTDAVDEVDVWLNKRGGAAVSTLEVVDALADVDSSNARLEDLMDMDEIKFLGANITEDQKEALFHNVSLYSKGLLTSVRRGGLLNDLSFYLETSEANRPTDALYEHAGIGGINFSELWAYYNIWKYYGNGSTVAHPDGGFLPADVPLLTSDSNPTTEGNSPLGPYRRPIMVRAGILFSLKAMEISGTDPVNYNIVVVADPVIILWNPFDVSLSVPSGSQMSVRMRGFPYYTYISKNGVLQSPTDPFDMLETYSFDSTITLSLGGGNFALRPGEVLVYSRSGDTGTEGSKGGWNNRTFSGQFGWNKDQGGFRMNTGIQGTASDEISVSSKARAGQNSGSVAYAGPKSTYFLEQIGPISSYWSVANVGGLFMDKMTNVGDSPMARNLPTMFPEIPETQLGSVGSLASYKRSFAFFSLGFRTEEGPTYPSRFLSRISRAGRFNSIEDFSDANMLSVGTEFEAITIDSNKGDPGFDVLGGSGFFGGGYDASTGQTRLITQSLPRSPIFSLAGFQHASATGKGRLFDQALLQPVVTSAIGNSHALPVLASNTTTGTTNGGQAAADHSFLVNEALWDHWYFSSIAPQTASVFDTSRTQREVFDGFLAGTLDLPSTRMRMAPWADSSDMTSVLFSDTTPNADAYEHSAEYLVREGAFNINSTNVDAWEAHLSALSEERVPVVDPQTGTMNWEDATGSPIPGLNLPAAGAIEDSELDDTANEGQWLGYRELDKARIRDLAEAIVAQIRLRGPFLSMSDFVNRRVGTNTTLASKGALQAALDSTVNAPLLSTPSRSITTADLPTGFSFPEAEVGARATGMPGFVDQADLLTLIGPGLSARSDTFKIRAMGQVKDFAGNVVSTARCEALMQRRYDYVDPDSDDPETQADGLKSTENQRFGRQFKIVSFRWLDKEEI